MYGLKTSEALKLCSQSPKTCICWACFELSNIYHQLFLSTGYSFLVWQARLHPPPGSEEPISSTKWGWRTPSDISKCQLHTDLTSSPNREGRCELQCKFWGLFIAHLWSKWEKSQPSRVERTICARTQVQNFHKAVAILVKWVKHPWVSWQGHVMKHLNESSSRWVGSRL